MENKDLKERLLQICCDGGSLAELLTREELEALPENPDWEIRSLTAEILACDPNGARGEALLCRLSEDSDDLVRVQAVDSLSAYDSPAAYRVMVRALADRNELVRCYGAYGVGAVGKSQSPEEAAERLRQLLRKEASLHVQAACWEGLYLLGHEDALERLMELFPRGDFQLRCYLLNGLKEFLNPRNAGRILKFVSGLDSYAGESGQELAEMCRTVLARTPELG